MNDDITSSDGLIHSIIIYHVLSVINFLPNFDTESVSTSITSTISSPNLELIITLIIDGADAFELSKVAARD